jgi:chromosome segregation ATPase
MSETEARVQNVENRATKTLELEEKITSNLSVQMEEQANKIVELKVEDLRMEIKKEIVELKKLGADLASKDIQEVVQEFKEMNTKLDKTKKGIDELLEQKTRDIDKAMDQKLNSIDKIVNTKMETIVKEKEQTFTKKVEVNAMDVNSLKRELAQKLLESETRTQALDSLQKQFLETLKKSNAEREELSTMLKKKVETFDARTDEKISIIDQRLKQLDVVVGELGNLLTQLKTQQTASRNTQPSIPQPAPEAPRPSQTKRGFNPFGK